MTIAVANVTTSVGNVYASSGNTAVTFLSLCNYSASNVTANVFVVPAGGTAGNLNIVLANIYITPGDTYQLYQGSEKLLLGNNDSIQANASGNNIVSTTTSYISL